MITTMSIDVTIALNEYQPDVSRAPVANTESIVFQPDRMFCAFARIIWDKHRSTYVKKNPLYEKTILTYAC